MKKLLFPFICLAGLVFIPEGWGFIERAIAVAAAVAVFYLCCMRGEL